MTISFYSSLKKLDFDDFTKTVQASSQVAQTKSWVTMTAFLAKIPKYFARCTPKQINDISDKQWNKFDEVFSDLMSKIPSNKLTDCNLLAYEVEKLAQRKFFSLPPKLNQFVTIQVPN